MKKAGLIILVVFSLVSCSPKQLLDSFHPIDNETWAYDQVIQDSFHVDKPDFYHSLFTNLRISGDYAYQNIQVRTTITDPKGGKKIDVIPITLAEKSGKWLGSGMGSTLTYQTPILGKQEFKHKGVYHVSIEQFMRVENLQHVKAVGLKVEVGEEIY